MPPHKDLLAELAPRTIPHILRAFLEERLSPTPPDETTTLFNNGEESMKFTLRQQLDNQFPNQFEWRFR